MPINNLIKGGLHMEAGVRNNLIGKIIEIKEDGLMAQVTMKVEGTDICITSVMTKDSSIEADFKIGDTVEALVKAINVVMVGSVK
jgi:molybdopterin-binding protein